MKKIIFIFSILTLFSYLQSEVPQAPVLKVINKNSMLKWDTENNANIQIGTNEDLNAATPSTWITCDSLNLETIGKLKVFAKNSEDNSIFSAIYDIQETFPDAAGEDNSTAIHMNDSTIKSWADSVISVTYGTNVSDEWKTPQKALGQAVGSSYDVVCLGDSGQITLKFNPAIGNGNGYDFCVFENSFSATFLELAFVEVSSDGNNFVRFDNAYLGTQPISAYGSHDTKLIGSLGGKYMQGYGNPFDLEVLKNKSLVTDGSVDLTNIKFVRIVDIVGDGNTFDSFGRIIYDPFPTMGSGGFDLDAIGVLNESTTSIIKNKKLSQNFELLQNYPNPFNPSTIISFNLNLKSKVKLSVFNSNGELVKNLLNKNMDKGNYNVNFEANNLQAGVYFYKLETNSGVVTKKMILVK